MGVGQGILETHLSLVSQSWLPAPSFLLEFWDQTADPYACKESILPTAPSLQPLKKKALCAVSKVE